MRFEMNFDAKAFAQEIHAEALKLGAEQVLAEVKTATRSVRCVAHGNPLTVEIVYPDGETAVSIDGCCQEAIDRGKALIGL